jgi:ATP-dependent RNA helicase DeaD
LSKEELIKKMVSVEFNRFINYYKKNRDLSSQSSGSERRDERAPRENTSGATRYFVNIGSRDNFDWMQLKDFLRDTLELGREDVYKVDVKEGFSFFNTDEEHTDKVMGILNGMEIEGRRINVEISKNDGGGRRDHNGRNSGGGFRGERNSGSRSGGFGPRKEGGGAPRSDRKEGGFRPRREGGSSERPRRTEGERPASRSFEAAKSRRPRRS